jgi:multidrug efflux system outer membrane protein
MMRVPLPSRRFRSRILPWRAGLRAAAAAAGTLLLAACHSVGPNYHGPPPHDTPLPTRFKNAKGDTGKWQPAEPKDAAARGSWWTIFRDPDLDRLETAALANNQDLRLALARIDESRAETRVAASDFFPHADFDGSYARARTSSNEPYQRGELVGSNPFGGSGGSSSGSASSGPVVITQQPLTRTYSLFRVPADLNWEVDLFGRVRRNYAAARATRQAVEADYQNVGLMVTANVAYTYFNLRALDTEETVTNQTIHSRQDALGIAQERLGAGLTSQLDVFREQSDLAGNRADLAAVQRSRDEMENALATLVGQPASSFRLGRHDLGIGKAPPRIPAGLPSRLLERRPDVAEAERQLAAANERIGVAVAAFFPRITITGAAGYESATILDVLDPASRIWQIGPSVSLPIFEGGRNTANLHAAVAQYNQQVARYRSQVLGAFQDVENALSDLRHLAEQAEAQGDAVEAAQRTLQLSSDQYRNGAVTFLDVADSERTLFNNQRTEAQLAGERMQATVQLIKALGGGWNN